MQTAAKQRLSAQDYLKIERRAETKSEFLDGEVFAMAGGTESHSSLAANAIAALHSSLKDKPCRVFTSDMRLKVEATGLYVYPDVQVACGNLEFEDESRDVLLNPKVIVEVLSESTEAWDRGSKFWHYRHIESFTDYLLVSQETWLVEHYVRQANVGWLLQVIQGAGGVLNLTSLGCSIPLVEIYAKTDINPEARLSTPKPETKP